MSEPISVRGATIANVDTFTTSGFASDCVIEIVWRMDVSLPWRSFSPAVYITSSQPFTTQPMDVSGAVEVAARVKTVGGSAGEIIVFVATDEIGR